MKKMWVIRHTIGILVASLVIVSGCATTPVLMPAPMPADIGWSAPRVEPMEPPLTQPPSRLPGPAELVIPFDEGTPVRVQVGVASGLALQFDADEYIVSVKGAYEEFKPTGDAAEPWKAVIERSGSKYPLVYLTATKPGMATSFMIPTNKGLYLVDAKSVQASRVRVVRWSREVPLTLVVQPPSLLPDPMIPATYHAGYTIDPATGGPTWMPVSVLDNGRRTFITFPVNVSTMSLPMARLIGNNGPELINPVMAGHVMVLDHIIPLSLELRLGSGETAEVVRVTRGPAVRIECPTDPACPTWSERVAGR